MVRIPSENPPGDTTAIVDFVAQHLSARGISVRAYAPKPDRPNLLATLDSEIRGRRLILNSHLDVFPVVGKDWLHPPFSGHLDGGRIFGRGASDMRAGLAASLFVFCLVKELDLALPGQLVISFSSDEESGGTWGTRWMLDHVPEIRGDACLIGDQCGTWAIGVGEKGGCWLRFRSSGVSGHAAYGTAASAIKPMLEALALLRELEEIRVSPPAELRAALESQARMIAGEWGEQAPDILDRVTANVGRVSGGSSINLVAEQCEAEVDIRLPIGLAPARVIERVREKFARAGLAAVHIEVITGFDPTWTSLDDPLVRSVANNSEAVRGKPALPVLRLGATDARWFRAAKIPTVVYGPKAYNMGGANEHVTVEDLLVTADVHAGSIVDYLNHTGE
jgi:succinyl-diaminopimelate desuccinylase